mgnify:CR=1 FL=1
MNYSQIKRRIANFDDRQWTDHVYAICNEFGVIAIVYADHEQDALDAAMDSGKLDSELMSESDYKEYERQGWDDSYMLLGNASEPVWSEYLSISKIK